MWASGHQTSTITDACFRLVMCCVLSPRSGLAVPVALTLHGPDASQLHADAKRLQEQTTQSTSHRPPGHPVPMVTGSSTDSQNALNITGNLPE